MHVALALGLSVAVPAERGACHGEDSPEPSGLTLVVASRGWVAQQLVRCQREEESWLGQYR